MKLPLEGGCQCGRVRYRVTGRPRALYACHCTECQRQSGSAFGLSLLVNHADMEVTGALNSFGRPTEGGDVNRGYFCPKCGTRIYHRNDGSPRTLSIKPGTLDDTSWLRPRGHIWRRSGQTWFIPPSDQPSHDGQPTDPGIFHLDD